MKTENHYGKGIAGTLLSRAVALASSFCSLNYTRYGTSSSTRLKLNSRQRRKLAYKVRQQKRGV